MKVTVCFGDLKVVVPCGDGDFLVSELVEKAVTRYKKASAKPGDFWVKVHALKNQRDGGILDLDDVLNDVVDDKDLILAEYDEQRTVSSPEQGEGDGTSSSSVGSMSPDLSRQQQRTKDRAAAAAAVAAAGSLVPPATVAALGGRVSVGFGVGDSGGGGGSVLQHVARFNGHQAGSADRGAAGLSSPVSERRAKAPAPMPPPKPAAVPAAPVFAATAAGTTTSAGLQQQPPLQLWRPAQPQTVPSSSLHGQLGSRNSVVVTETDLNKATGLQVLRVRRGSESNLVTLPAGDAAKAGTDAGEAGTLLKSEAKQWLPRTVSHKAPMNEMHEISTDSAGDEDGGDEDGEDQSRLTRVAADPARRSLTGDSMLKWTAAAASAAAAAGDAEEHEQQAAMRSRHEPLGQSGSPNVGDRREMAPPPSQWPQLAADTLLVALDSSISGPLGIHVVPNVVGGRDAGLVIQDIEPGGRIDQDGRLSLYDLIEEINGCNIMALSFEEAQSIFRQALMTNQVVLRVRKNGGAAMAAECDSSFEAQDAPGAAVPAAAAAAAVPPAAGANPGYSYHEKDSSWPHGSESVGQHPPTPAQRLAPLPNGGGASASGSALTISPPPAHLPASRSPSAQLTSPSSTLMKANTRKIGKRLTIELLKGPEGLGFSITTRDNPAGGVAPIYVKNILPKGAAIADGRLKSGDRILEINGIDTTGKSQDEAVAMLRNTKRGSIVTFVVSRQELAEQSSATLPRQLPSAPEQAEDARLVTGVGVTAALAGKQLLAFDIPLNESGSAGLGVSVKGKTSATTAAENGGVRDLGIFVKAVITGGAASKDGRVEVNDQLIEVNGESLLDKSNSEAMEALRRAMRAGGPAQGHIRLTVARAAAGGGGISAAAPSLPSTPEPLDGDDEEVGIDSAYQVKAGGRSSDMRRPSDGGLVDASFAAAVVSATAQQPPRLPQLQPTSAVQQSKPDKGARSGGGGGGARGVLATVAGLRNPVLDRLTGGGARMEANDRRGDDDEESGGSGGSSSDDALALYGASATTLPTPQAPRDTVIIEDDSQPVVQRRERSSGSDFTKVRPYSAIGGVGLLAGVDERPLGNVLDTSTTGQQPADPSSSSGGVRAGAEKLHHRESTTSSTPGTFEREGFGRRSFSEKRKVEKNKELVEKAKALRDDAKEKANDAPPTAKLSSSTENLRGVSLDDARGNGHGGAAAAQTAGILWRPLAQGARGRACNESFRAAVDRSYDGPPASGRAAHVMSIVQEEVSETGQSGAVRNTSARSSFSDRAGSTGGGAASGSSDQASENSKGQKKDKKASKVTSGGFLGNLLRLTKARKSMEDRMPARTPSSASSVEQPTHLDVGGKPGSSQAAYQSSITATDKSKIDERYRRMQDTQRAQLVAAASTASSSSSASGSSTAGPQRPQPQLLLKSEYSDYAEIPAQDYGRAGSPGLLREQLPPGQHQFLTGGDKASRSRQEHRDRHGERPSRRPQDERDDFYEQKIREREAREWEANNRANIGNGLNPNWKVPMMIERGGSDVSLARQSQPDVSQSNFGAGQSGSSTSRNAGGISRPYLYESNSAAAAAAGVRPAAGASGMAVAAPASEKINFGSRERSLQPEQHSAAEADYMSLTRHPRARTPEPQPWKRQQQQQHLQQQQTSGVVSQPPGPAAVSPALLSRGHQRYASYDSTGVGSSGNWSSAAAAVAYHHDYDDPRRAYAEHVATMTARPQQLQRQQPAVSVGLHRNLATGPAQV